MLRIENLDFSYPATRGERQPVLRDVSLICPAEGIVAVLGPSGAGKSSLLNTIAGLLRPDAGSISFAGEHWFGGPDGAEWPPARRKIGMMLQSYALWPHMNVRQHLEFPLEHGFGKVSRAERDSMVAEMLTLLDMDGLESRRPNELSGGQQQRLALGRAMINRPRLILLDEPFSNIDPNKRKAIARDIRRIQRHFRLAAVIATHDHADVALIADSLAVILDGTLAQQDTPDAIYNRPVSRAVGEFMGDLNLIPVTSVSQGVVHTALVDLPFSCVREPATIDKDARWLAFRPDAVQICAPSPDDRMRGRITDMSYAGGIHYLTVATGGAELMVSTFERPSGGIGAECAISFPPASTFLLSR